MCDADLGLSNTAVQLGLAQGGDLPGCLAGRTNLKDAVVRVQTGPHGFDLLGAPAGSGALADSDGETAEQLVHCLKRASYERVLIDLGAGIGAAVMTLAAHADDMVVLATPDPSALTDAYAFVKLLLKRTGGRPPALVVNMAASAGEAKRTAEALTRSTRTFLKTAPTYLGFIPNDVRVVECIRRQTALVTLYPQSAAATAIAGLAGALGGQTGRPFLARSLR